MRPIDFDIRESILHTDGNIVISASAGTGKTHTTVLRIIDDSKKNTDYHTFAAITFTRKAAKEIANRLGVGKGDGFIGTNDNFVLAEIIQPFLYDVYGKAFKKEIKPDYSSANVFDDFEYGINIIKKLGLMCKYRNNRINFAFQLALDILKKSRAARRYLEAKYYRIYIDEYQDSDVDMHNLFVYICKEIGIDLFIVGDIKQSIYGWRGGYLNGFKNIIEDSDFSPFKLKQNFRSNIPIQNYSNIFMDDVRDNFKMCTLQGEITGFAYSNRTEAVSYIGKWLNRSKNCAFLIRTNADAEAWSNLLSDNQIDFRFLPSSPLDNTNLESEHIWVSRVLAFYLLQERYSEYDVLDEIPLPDSIKFADLRKRLENISNTVNNETKFGECCLEFYKYLGYESSNKIENEIKVLYSVVNDPKYVATYNPNNYKNVVTTIHASKGLEYNQVIIIAENYNLNLEDDQYLHYVAVSRPEERLLVLFINREKHPYIATLDSNINKVNLIGFNITRRDIIFEENT